MRRGDGILPDWRGATLAAVACAAAVLSSARFVAVLAQTETAHELTLTADTGERVTLRYEIVADPSEALFASPAGPEVHPDGRQFWFDGGDQDFKVLGPDNEFLFAFGGRGQGPGQWQHVGASSFGPDGRFYVWDEMARVMHVYDDQGNFLRRIHLANRLAVATMVWLQADKLLLAGLSFAPDYYGYLGHVVQAREDEDSVWRYEHLVSVIPVPEYAPGLYRTLAGGIVLPHGDQGLVATMTMTHQVAYYSRDLDLLWSVEDSTILPDRESRMTVDSSGRVRVQQHPRVSWAVVVGDWIVQEVMLPPEGLPELDAVLRGAPDADLSTVKITRLFEFVSIPGEGKRRFIVRTEEPLSLKSVDADGRVYGLIGNFDRVPIRGRLTISPE